MSDNGIKSVPASTGQFVALQLTTKPGTGTVAGGVGNPQAGKSVPRVAGASLEKPDMAAIAQSLNMANKSIGNQLRFEVDLENGRSVIQVLDRETGEIIRQIPPEQAKSVVAGNGIGDFRLYDDRI